MSVRGLAAGSIDYLWAVAAGLSLIWVNVGLRLT